MAKQFLLLTVLARLLPWTTGIKFIKATERVQKMKKLIENRDAGIAKYIPGTLELVFQGMPGDIDTKEQPANVSYKDMENLEFQIMLTNNYYTNLNSMRICFQ